MFPVESSYLYVRTQDPLNGLLGETKEKWNTIRSVWTSLVPYFPHTINYELTSLSSLGNATPNVPQRVLSILMWPMALSHCHICGSPSSGSIIHGLSCRCFLFLSHGLACPRGSVWRRAHFLLGHCVPLSLQHPRAPPAPCVLEAAPDTCAVSAAQGLLVNGLQKGRAKPQYKARGEEISLPKTTHSVGASHFQVQDVRMFKRLLLAWCAVTLTKPRCSMSWRSNETEFPVDLFQLLEQENCKTLVLLLILGAPVVIKSMLPSLEALPSWCALVATQGAGHKLEVTGECKNQLRKQCDHRSLVPKPCQWLFLCVNRGDRELVCKLPRLSYIWLKSANWFENHGGMGNGKANRQSCTDWQIRWALFS